MVWIAKCGLGAVGTGILNGDRSDLGQNIDTIKFSKMFVLCQLPVGVIPRFDSLQSTALHPTKVFSLQHDFGCRMLDLDFGS